MGKTTKICKHCRAEIDKKATVCPNCKKNLSSGCLNGCLLVFLAFFFVIGAIVMIGSSGSDDEEHVNISNTSNKVLGSGETFESDGLKVTITEVNTDFKDYKNEYGLHDLENGKKYIKISFTYENTGKDDKYVSIYDYECYADGTLCEQYFYFEEDFINANISSGRNVSFDTWYIVPKNANSIELEYTKNIWTDEKVVIKVK